MRSAPRPLKRSAAEAAQFRARAAFGFLVVLLSLAGLALWYFKLQVIDHADYATRSEANRIKLRPVVPGRGIIYDRKGRILADNVPAYRLDVVPEDAGNPQRLIAALSRIIVLTPEDIARFEAERRASRGFRAITLKLGLGEEEAARFAVDRWRYPGVELVPYLTRRYPYGELFAHEIGYVARIDAQDRQNIGEANAAFTHTGKTGLERYYDEALRGRIGYEQVETNVEGRALGTVGRVPAVPGADLKLGIDLDLQRAMTLAFGGMEGSAVAVDPNTGEVLAMVSLPSFDPNLFVNGISHAQYRALMDNISRPLFNRNVLGGGPPGSTLKPFVALAGLESGLRTPQDRTLSTGEFFIPGQRRGYRDSSRGGHGWVDLAASIGQSVNTYYYKLALDLGIERFGRLLGNYGFGSRTGVDLLGENPGVVPSPQWKAERSKEPWYVGETVIAGIGQGYWLVTPLQLAQATAAIAAGGARRRLHLVKQRRDGYNAPWRALPQPTLPPLSDNPQYIAAVRAGMLATVYGARGTATRMAQGAPYRIAGKTGTVQKIGRRGSGSTDPRSLPPALRHKALFIGYAPADAPTIAVAVVVEQGGYGSSTAAPIARKVFDAWLLGKMPEPDPATIAPPAAAAAPATRGAPDFGNVITDARGPTATPARPIRAATFAEPAR